MKIYSIEEFALKFNTTITELNKLEKLQVLIPFYTRNGKKYYTEKHCVQYINFTNENKDIFSLVDFCNTLNTYETKTYKKEKIHKETHKLPEPYFSIKKMREIHYNPFEFSQGDLFCKEAKILHTINIEEEVKSQHYFGTPTLLFNKLTNNQIIYYIKWRTLIRKNILPPPTKECWIIYLSELINFIEFQNPQEIFNKLLFLLDLIKNNNFHDYFIKKILVNTIKDFWIIHNKKIDFSLTELQEIINIESEKDILKDFINNNFLIVSLGDFEKISSYKLTDSIFLKEENNKKLYIDILQNVFSQIDNYLLEKESSFNNVIFNKKISIWKPYGYLIYNNTQNFSVPQINFSNFETYYSSGKEIVVKETYTAHYPDVKKIIGYIAKKTEEITRLKYNFKTKITTKKTDIKNLYFSNKTIKHFFESEEIDEIIEKLISQKIKSLFKKEYVFNINSINQIKEVTNKNESKLIVEDYSKELEAENKTEQKDSLLTKIEIEFLHLLLKNEDTMLFCKQNNVMLEIIIDNINNKLYDLIGDNIIELDSNPLIYEDYIEELKKILEENL